ncbi:MAG TPA: hypothetical protein VNQ79_15845 [Blastocatellia bacterium]|nr:hypothetical protein [Blastocatellia bacterium]
MAIEFEVDSLDQVEESLRTAYTADGERFRLDPDKYAELKAEGLKRKNRELIGKLNAYKPQLERAEKFKEISDEDFDQFIEWREAQEQGGHKGKQNGGDPPVDPAELRKLQKSLAQREKEAKDATSRIGQLESELSHYKLTVPLRDIALRAGVFAEDLDVVMLETQKRFRLDDKGRIVVLDDDGDVSDVTPEKFFTEIYKEKRPKFFAASDAAGSGATPGNRSPGIASKKRSEMTVAEKSAFIEKHGYEKYLDLPEK